ncbi:nucleotide exchange factor GrpE [Anthropogastromicrobium aceti]|jgi:molecular chaperone GrpE|uniref:nucleotide exchange factor GrpE n=1 Tax=Anthropogastromicrobium aceti TaxID=2981768 RepID=UPI000EDA3BE3|nr:nucleotide exchange factor GrpE [Anthropogastromicrobium aceti]MBS1469363.1 nucleotide exchange factor GrpE [Lachnospiraceae bacterium]MCB7125274.1 nucleotide exchange factor GrpE [Lachnoclostridium sp. 210928-DFI.6.3]MCU6783574.1 nucleotide exchange factor GrpE [Anthropogastromicrobium aceti]MED9927448.1 nucleotide exchange factor GrpE [Lachnospiraceae bacterium]MEE0833162.1 nucleotide exchange factor GrpE [Lachnospiraceae bacterium]
MEKETVADEILEETEQEAAEDMSQEQTDAQAAENQPDDKDVQTDDKKRFFGKKKDKKDKQIEDLTAQLDDLRKRNLAEFENFRKRTEKEKSTMFDMGAKSVLEKLLPIIDNFERGFAGLSEEQMSDPFVSGMDMVYKQLVKALADMGVEPIEAVGKPFDPNLHNAVMHVEDENLGENTVAQEFQKGYLYHGSVVRHSMVQVAN